MATSTTTIKTTTPAYADPQAAANINNMYNANISAQLANLENAYNQNMSNAQKAKGEINPAYQQKANDLGTQFERNRRNFNIQAAGNGLNTGVGSQAALAQNSAYQRDYGNLRLAQQAALNEAQRGIDQLTASYNSDINAAKAQNDFERSQALLAQYKTDYANKLTQAANLAKYGDFSGYNGIYSAAQIKQMEANWKASNPDLAYNTGKITAAQYKKMTGKYPAGYTAPSSGGGGGGGNGSGTARTTTANSKNKLTDAKGTDNLSNTKRSNGISVRDVANTAVGAATAIAASPLLSFFK